VLNRPLGMYQKALPLYPTREDELSSSITLADIKSSLAFIANSSSDMTPEKIQTDLIGTLQKTNAKILDGPSCTSWTAPCSWDAS